MCYATKEWYNIKRKTDSWFEKRHKEFSCELPKSEKVCLLFDGILLSIASWLAYKVSAKKVRKSYLSWHVRVIQTLKKNWILVFVRLKHEEWHEEFGEF